MRLAEKVAIITGAGSGIGRALAIRFAEEGAKLLLPDINRETAEATAADIRAKGGEAAAIQVDISDESAAQRMAEKVIGLYGKVDILVNNAGMITGFKGRLWDQWTVEIWDRFFITNVRGTWLVSKAIAPLMVRQGSGKIINIVSDIPKVPDSAAMLPYACTKSALYTLTHSLARSLGSANINVNAIAPGRTDTSVSSTGQAEIDDHSFDRTIAIQCLKRREKPEDLAGTTVFLASADADFITGQIIFVDGGAVMN